jgi:hypothetical protein
MYAAGTATFACVMVAAADESTAIRGVTGLAD